MSKKILAMLLCLCMILSLLQTATWAEGENGSETVPETTAVTIPETIEAAAPETTEAAVPEATEAAVPEATEAAVPETTEAAVPEATEAAVLETTEAAVPETTEAIVPETTEAATVETVSATGIVIIPPEQFAEVLMVGQSAAFAAQVTPADAEDMVIWESSDPTVATVDAEGIVTGVAEGEVIITAMAGSVQDSYPLIILSGNPQQATEETVLETIDEIAPEAVSSTGIVITPPEQFAEVLMVGQNAAFTAQVTPADAEDMVIWESSDPTVATVDAEGIVTGVAEGEVIITAMAGSVQDSYPLIILSGDIPLMAMASGTPDITPPVLNGITLSKTSVTAPGEIEVTIDAEDAISGTRSAYIFFSCEETGKKIDCNLNNSYFDNHGNSIPYADGKLHGTLKIDQHVAAGTFKVNYVSLVDVAGNYADYRGAPTEQLGSLQESNSLPLPQNFLNLEFVVEENPQQDTMPPVLKNITLSANSVTAPDKIEVTIDAEDDISGIRSAHIYFSCEEIGKGIQCNLDSSYLDNHGFSIPYADGKLHGVLKIGQYAAAGTFKLNSVDLVDVAGNRVSYNTGSYEDIYNKPLPSEFLNLEIVVEENPQQDTTPPVLKNITLSATSVAAPGVIEIIVDAEDNIAGLNYGGLDFICEETNKGLSCELYSRNSDQGNRILYGALEIDQYVADGTFKLDSVYLFDLAGNDAYYMRGRDVSNSYGGTSQNPIPSEFLNLEFVVDENVQPDYPPAVFKNITLSATRVTAPGEIEVIVDAEDDILGLSGGEISFACRETDRRISCSLNSGYYDNRGGYIPYEDGKLHGILEIGQYVVSGTFKLANISLRDISENYVSYGREINEHPEWYRKGSTNPIPSEFLDLEFVVEDNPLQDTTPPVLKNITLSATSVTAPGKIEVIVDAEDNISGLSYGQIDFICEEIGKNISLPLYSYYFDNQGNHIPYSDGKLHGIYEIGQYAAAGTFKLRIVSLDDAAGNSAFYDKYYDSELPDLEFVVEENPQQDTTPPVLKNIKLSATGVTAPGKIEVIVEAEDNISGLESCQVSFTCRETGEGLHCQLSSGYYDNRNCFIHYADGKLHGILEIDQYLAGTFQLDTVTLYDAAGNCAIYDRYNNPELPDLEIVVEENPQPDTTPPALKNITLSATRVTAPGEIEVIVEAEDDIFGLGGGGIAFVCDETEEYISCGLRSDYFDDQGNRIPYADGKLHGILVIDQSKAAGTFKLCYIYLDDVVGNSVVYQGDGTESSGSEPIPSEFLNLEFIVEEKPKPDITPPVLNGITLSATNVTAPGEIEVIVDAKDDISGLSHGYISFTCEETGKSISCSLDSRYVDQWYLVPYADGKLHGLLEIGQYTTAAGTFKLDEISLSDGLGNSVYYIRDFNEGSEPYGKNFCYKPIPSELLNLEFTVAENPQHDTTPPVLKNITLSTARVTAPGEIEIIVDAEDDISGLSFGSIAFTCEETGKSISCSLDSGYYDNDNHRDYIPYADGKLHGILKINPYAVAGTYKLDCVYLNDAVYNSANYDRYNNPELPDLEIVVEENLQQDTTPPVLKNITLSAARVTAPGKIDVIVDAEDDISGLSSGSIEFRCAETNETISASLDRTYLDRKTYQYVPYPDGKLHGILKINPYAVAGTYKLHSISLVDAAGNYVDYSSHGNYNSKPIPSEFLDLEFVVEENLQQDTTPPVLKNITLSAARVTAPDKIEVEVIIEAEDISGLESGYVSFTCGESGVACPYLWSDYIDDQGNRISYADGELHGIMIMNQTEAANTLKLGQVTLGDVVGNYEVYRRDCTESYWYRNTHYKPFPSEFLDLEFVVKEKSQPDTTPPVLRNITLSATKVNAPGEIEVIVDAEDDVSGLRSGSIEFRCAETNKAIYAYLNRTYWDDKTYQDVLYPDGKLHGTLKIDQYVATGNFKISSISLRDVADNPLDYLRVLNDNPGSFSDYAKPIPSEFLNLSFIVSTVDVGVITSVANPSFLSYVQNADNDSLIVASYSGNTTLTSDVFAAIQGTNKKLSLISQGITWEFNGAAILSELKDIELNVDIKPLHESSAESQLTGLLGGAPAMVMEFAENGTLPGKATIRVEVDHAMREYLKTDDPLSVYYYNNATKELELIAKDLVVLTDGYVEFPITHCGTYLLTYDLNRMKNSVPLGLPAGTVVYIDGQPHSVGADGSVPLSHGNAKSAVTYSMHIGDAKDVHTHYPTGMKVWMLNYDKGTETYTAARVPALDNILQYSGSSIRITGKRGIRMITSLDRGKKAALTGGGLAGYTLEEYGTALCWASDLPGGTDLTLGQGYTRSNHAYKRGVADPVFAYSGNLVQYTNVLVGIREDMCAKDIVMRPYIILKNASGEQITLYGGSVHRSIGYIAWQNRNVFSKGSDAYNYVHSLINSAYSK